MDQRKRNWISGVFIGLTVLVIALMLANTLHRPGRLTLPDTNSQSGPSTEDPSTQGSALTVVEVTPQTVQRAIASLSRVESYRRTVEIEQFWDGGSGSYETAVTVSGLWTRMDRTMPDGGVRHSILGPESAYIWYNNERRIYQAPAGDISADNEQAIPTYEEILDLPTEEISSAEFSSLSGIPSIYVEASAQDYTLRYWVSVDTGLLVAAERLLGEKVVYRMEALSVDLSELSGGEFVLPDGTSLL